MMLCVYVIHTVINSLASRGCDCNFESVIIKCISMINILCISCKIALWWKAQDLTDDKSTLDQVMAWCRQAASHHLSQCWPRSLSPYGVTRPQWVKAHHLHVSYNQFPGCWWPGVVKPCITWPNNDIWINSLWSVDAMWCQCSWPSLVHVMACFLFGAKPLPETMMTLGSLKINPQESTSLKFCIKYDHFPFDKMCFQQISHLQNVGHFVLASMW